MLELANTANGQLEGKKYYSALKVSSLNMTVHL